jgi:hypothetical protein
MNFFPLFLLEIPSKYFNDSTLIFIVIKVLYAVVKLQDIFCIYRFLIQTVTLSTLSTVGIILRQAGCH